MNTKYIVLEAADSTTLADRVNEAIESGATLVGGISYANGTADKNDWYCQAALVNQES